MTRTYMPPTRLIALYDAAHRRKLLTRAERDGFLRTAATGLGEVRTLCNVLAYTGCYLTEALELTYDRVDAKRQTLTFESLRKRQAGVWRTVPVPPPLIDLLDEVHNVRERRGRGRYRFLWTWSRTSAWRKVRAVMAQAGIAGPQATSLGLRHGFGVIAVECDVPLTLLQQWMGHASIEITASYAQTRPYDAQTFAARMWSDSVH
jgi:integrase/recombinase XerD